MKLAEDVKKMLFGPTGTFRAYKNKQGKFRVELSTGSNTSTDWAAFDAKTEQEAIDSIKKQHADEIEAYLKRAKK